MGRQQRPRGLIIAVSGMESSGKTTQMELLRKYLESRGRAPLYLWIRPGYTPGIQRLKRCVRSLKGKRSPEISETELTAGDYPKRATSFRRPVFRWLWLTTGLCDLLWTCCVRLRYHRARSRTVLIDRYLLDAWVDFRPHFSDQQVERRLPSRMLKRYAVTPDASFCLMIPAEESHRRSTNRRRRHQDSLAQLLRKEELYREAAIQFGANMLDGELTTKALFDELCVELDRLNEGVAQERKPSE